MIFFPKKIPQNETFICLFRINKKTIAMIGKVYHIASILCFLLLFVAWKPVYPADEPSNYFETLRLSNKSDYAAEQSILKSHTIEQLTAKILSYYTDTATIIRQKAYYLTYKKGLQSAHSGRTVAVRHLLSACNDADGGIVGQGLRYLQEFSVEDFDDECRAVINGKIAYTKTPHYKELVLLSGYIHTGKDELQKVLLNVNLPERHRWYVALALSRSGDPAQTAYCMRKVEKLPVNSDLVSYVLPDLIYMRQKEAIDYCVELLNSDAKLCDSQNPDISEKINCAYPLIPLLAPAIADFPVEIDASGDIAGDYIQALNILRQWFSINKDYKIVQTTF
ncbi:MAG: hypothetical protein LBR08_01165 [Bacteroidales bacterium]|nr:hypothetical protein [Bacteroidales bacterium]